MITNVILIRLVVLSIIMQVVVQINKELGGREALLLESSKGKI